MDMFEKGNRSNEEVIARHGIKKRLDRMSADLAKKIKVAALNTNFMKKEELKVTYESDGRCLHID